MGEQGQEGGQGHAERLRKDPPGKHGDGGHELQVDVTVLALTSDGQHTASSAGAGGQT